MKTREFSKDLLRDLLDGYPRIEAKVIQDQHLDISRWSERRALVFKAGDEYYSVEYSQGLTEYQDEKPFEYETDPVPCLLVEPHVETVTTYRAVK